MTALPHRSPVRMASWRRGGSLLRSGLFFAVIGIGAGLSASEVPTYAKTIQPILADRCYSCHGPDKQKGDLRLDSPEAIKKGGKNGAVLVAGDLKKSTLYTLTLLPVGDDDRMPGKGDPLTQAQTDALRDWVAAGASFDGSVAAAKPVSERVPLNLGPSSIDQLSAKWSKPDASAVAAVVAAGGIITPVSVDGAALDVDLSHLGTALDASHLKLVERLANNIVWLDLHGLALTDAGLASVAKCRNLVRLHLDRTGVTDNGLKALAACPSLEYLNLIGTGIGDAGLAHLTAFKHLERLYLMQTKATDAGIATLTKALPELVVNHGPQFSTVEVKEPEGGKKRKK